MLDLCGSLDCLSLLFCVHAGKKVGHTTLCCIKSGYLFSFGEPEVT